MRKLITPTHLDQAHLPADEWCLREERFERDQLALMETLFATGNGYIGFRGDLEEDWDNDDPGVYVNGFHETWSIHHAENAFGFATTGQTIVNAPDGKGVALFVDDETLDIGSADLSAYSRELDMRDGVLRRRLTWRTATGKLVTVESERLVSLTQRHLAAVRYRVTVEQGTSDTPNTAVLLASTIKNRQDRLFDSAVAARNEAIGTATPETDPRRHRTFNHHVLQPRVIAAGPDGTLTAAYECTNSQMRIACVVRHTIEVTAPDGAPLAAGTDGVRIGTSAAPEELATTAAVLLPTGATVTLTKYIAYHTSPLLDGAGRGPDAAELVVRGGRTLDRAVDQGYAALVDQQRGWLHDFWQRADVTLEPAAESGATELQRVSDQQAVRWNLLAIAQASAQVGELGISAKGVSAGGYEGHYFWDTEMYLAPMLSYTRPEVARQLLRFRWRLLPLARLRARELNQAGALYPWRTINGEEASAYYAAGTAQYHINAAVAFALKRYVDASGDIEFLATDGAEILVETARLWSDLGFYSERTNGNGRSANGRGRQFHIHGVTGPDEYTAVVNDNLYTNVMARFNMRWAARVVELLELTAPDALRSLVEAVDLRAEEEQEWIDAAEAMFLPYDEERRIHPQDAHFLDREPWDFANTPDDKYPLLLNFHPLVIYRHQVLKQADVVLAMSLRSDQFSERVRRRNFDYYDPITTGDSSLSACVQAMAAAQVGHGELAEKYFHEALYVDLANTHGNSRDGVHVASAGGVWNAVVFGFAGLFETGTALSFDPQLPAFWSSITFKLTHHGSRLAVELDPDGCTVAVLSGDPVPVHVSAGFTGMSPEPTGSADDIDPDELDRNDTDGAEPIDPADPIDAVVLIEPGQSLHIPRRR